MARTIIMIILFSMALSFFSNSMAQQKTVTKPAPQQKPTVQPLPIMKAPTIDPAMLRRLQGSVARSTMINTLMGNQTTRVILENLAKNAKISVNELSIKTLDGNPVSPTPQGQQIDQLNWNAGIKISMIKNRPRFFLPPTNSTLPLGWIGVHAVDLNSEFISYYIDNDIFPFVNTTLYLYLPLTPATYMFTIQVSPPPHHSLPSVEVYLSDRTGVKKIQNVVPLSSKDGHVFITQILPSIYPNELGFCYIEVKRYLFDEAFLGGFIITRL